MPQGDDPVVWMRSLYEMVVNLTIQIDGLRTEIRSSSAEEELARIQTEIETLRTMTSGQAVRLEKAEAQLNLARWIGGGIGLLALATLWRVLGG